MAHRLAWYFVYGEFPENIIDHINGIRSDNRISNLRDCTYSVNQQNRRNAAENNKTGYLGVSYQKSHNKYRATLKVNGKQKTVGKFDSAEEAYKAYLNAKRLMHEGCTI